MQLPSRDRESSICDKTLFCVRRSNSPEVGALALGSTLMVLYPPNVTSIDVNAIDDLVPLYCNASINLKCRSFPK